MSMVIFVIPIYNEEKNIPTLLSRTRKICLEEHIDFRMIAVDDGSTDKSLDILKSSKKEDMPLEICSYHPNKGVGEAFRRGFEKALEIGKDTDIVVTKEADNTSDPGILRQLILKIEDGYDLALASCYAKEGKVLGTTFYRKFLSECANMLLKIFVPIKGIHTYSSFYRAYRLGSLRQLSASYKGNLITSNGFECMVELLIKFGKDKRFKITEVPMILQGSGRIGKSKMRVMRTTIGFLKAIFKEGIIGSIKDIFKAR